MPDYLIQKLESKMPGTETSIFAVMSQLASEHNAINLSQGFPDFNCSPELIELINKYQKGLFNQYAPMPGVRILRERISEKVKKIYNHFYDIDSEITITSGATQALFTAISCVVKEGDEVIVIEPAYDSYDPVIRLNKGIPVYVSLKSDDFSFDWDAVKDAITNRTRMIIINSPHNPAGSVLNLSDLKILEDITRNTNIIIVSDEVYEHIIFDGHSHISLSQSEELSQRSFVISSFGKTYHATGWKVGYCCAPKNLTDEFRKIHQFIVFAVNTPAQYAYAEYMQDESHHKTLSNFYQKKRDILIDSLSNSLFKIIPASGTYFQILDYSEISSKNDMEFSFYLTKEIGVAVIPISPFCYINKDRKIIRLCFAKNEDVLISAAKKLSDVRTA